MIKRVAIFGGLRDWVKRNHRRWVQEACFIRIFAEGSNGKERFNGNFYQY